jgi:formylglycine-generating enzyme required for sulfatase activity
MIQQAEGEKVMDFNLGNRTLRSIALCGTLSLAACATPQYETASSDETDCLECPELVTIPGGTFTMGRDGGEPDRYDGPPHEVTVPDFQLAKYEVTHGEYRKFVDETNHVSAQACSVAVDGLWGHRDWANWQNPGLGRDPQDNEPVACVSWNDATAYIEWLSTKTSQPYRLPTEAEFEFAVRAGGSSTFPWGEDPEIGCGIGNFFDSEGQKAVPEFPWEGAECSDGFGMVAPVGSFKPNSLGLHDIVGNLWEWTQDCYVLPYPEDKPVDGSAQEVEGDCEMRTVRGGSWETRASRMASAWRGRDKPHEAFRTFGFRIAK